ncbi:MAG TPA: FecR domain-containing protein [Phnomibacter sp.]|nr:FecR domain-containing protein [Phnomibacter sp.]
MDDLLIKYLLQECSPQEAATVQAWMQQSEANQKRYNSFVWLWQQSETIGQTSKVNVDAAWDRFVDLRKESAVEAGKAKVISMESSRRRWLMVAASAVVLLAAAWLAKITLWPQAPQAPAIVMLQWTTTDQTLTDTLPDGSVVTLNKNSTLHFPSAFTDSTRRIRLEGEAFFDITPDKTHPFIVATGDVQVRVVGTSFNVRNRKGVTKVVVETGIVQVQHKQQSVSLKPKEQVTVQAGDTVLQKKNTGDLLYQYYRSHVFVCDNTGLPILVQALNEAYDANIVIGHPSLRSMHITTTFNNESLDTVLSIITETLGIKAVHNGNTIVLSK